jgi:multisubunit Na+/H+ antiporter MnhB subunit
VTIGNALDILLCVLLLVAAAGAVASRRPSASVSLFIVYGLLLAIGWVRLGAVDVALAEAAIGAGLTGVLLLSAVARLRTRLMPKFTLQLLPLLASAAMAGVLMWVAVDLAQHGQGLQTEVAANLQESGAQNPVTAVLLSFRGYDTLLETVVLLIALVCVWSLTPDSKWGGRPGVRQRVLPDGVLATFGRFLPPFGLLVGTYLVWIGGTAPGGAFQGATVLAAVWLLTIMAGVTVPPSTTQRWLRWAVIGGPLLFIGIGAAGLAFGAFLAYPPQHLKVTVFIIEVGLALSISLILALLLLGPPREEP